MNSKRKGSAGEREVCKILLDAGFTASRNDQRYIGGAGNPDVAAVIHGRQMHIECKRTERLRLDDAMEQAIRDAAPGWVPVVFHRKNRSDWLVTMRLSDFLE